MKKSICVVITAMMTLAGCGGGSAAPAVGATPATPVPTLSLSTSASKSHIGSPVTVTWSSTNASSCVASGAWSGNLAPSGSVAFTPAEPGSNALSLNCTGSGGAVQQSVALTVPYPSEKSSYENKMMAAAAIGPQVTSMGNAIAYADFFQDGTISRVIHTLVYDNRDPSTASKFGQIQFWKKINGAWRENTAPLLADTTGCLHPRKAIVADFNNDGVPDVFFACHGFDAPPFSGEKQHMLLSQKDGTYKNLTMPYDCYCHGASAADINGDGYPDIAVTDTSVTYTPHILINNKDGTFAQDLTRLPATLKYRGIYSAELIDFDKTGKYDLWLSGNELNATKVPVDAAYVQAPTIYKNDGFGGFISTTPLVLPGDTVNGIALDINFVNNSIYLLRTSIYDDTTTYNTTAIQKIDYKTLASTTLYTHAGPYPSNQYIGSSSPWIDWIIPYQGKIASMNAAFGVSLDQ